MMKLSVNSEYISVACNRVPAIADWNSDGIICFGATNSVIVYNTRTKDKNPLTVLSHHRARVNSVKWIIKKDTSAEFLSCSNDKSALIWSNVNETWKITGHLNGHTEGVSCVDGLYDDKEQLVVYTASIDSTIKIWIKVEGEILCSQTILLGSGLCITLRAYILPQVNKPILFCALDDHKIHVYGSPALGKDDYQKLHILSGHEDWVRGLDIMTSAEDTLLLASCSQDTYIRLWKVQHHKPDESPTTGIKVEEKVFRAYDKNWSVKLDAVLAGHEGWVYGVQWHPAVWDSETKTSTPVYRLLSSSLDKTLIIWEPDSQKQDNDHGVWVEKVRVGEVGGNGLGFYGSKFGPDGKSFLGHGYNGSFHIWKLDEEKQTWLPTVVCGGHFGEVSDIRWEREGKYLASLSVDQTTRIHAIWKQGGINQWHEVARPQVHGYDMASLALVSSSCFVSAAEEKVLRVFQAPHNFVHNFSNITGHQLCDSDSQSGDCPEGATVPSLGLSNKAVFSGDEQPNENDNDGYFVPVSLTVPPTEETLMQNTLWPEIHKLYGHGYEVYCVDASADGSLVASACKATTVEHAAIIIWETKSWQQIQKLPSHSLTVTQLAFSPNSHKLVSVSRDRKWTLFQRQLESNHFETVATTDKTNGVHSRIIWCCSWSHDSVIFATGSRDGKVCLWSKTVIESGTSLKNYALLGQALEAVKSVTALAFAPKLFTIGSHVYRVLALGYDSGTIELYSVNITDKSWSKVYELDNSAAHHLTVKKMSFKPASDEELTKNELKLASCGSDHFVRIHHVQIFTS